jgi:hypothetical protein
METEQDEDIWAVILTASGKFVGKLTIPQLGIDTKLGRLARMVSAIRLMGEGEPLSFNPVYELNIHMIPVPVSANRVAMHREVTAVPFGLTLEPAPMHLCPTGLQFFEEMADNDKSRYTKLVEQAAKIAQEARASDAGITLARVGN